jgi:hypothetical protein
MAKERGERGAALVETALVLPLLLTLTFGIWAAARAWQVHNTLDHAVREAARYGATEDPWDSSSVGDLRAVIDAELTAASIPITSVATICIEKGASPCGIGAPAGAENVVVQVRYAGYPFNVLFWQTNIDLNAAAVARWED